MNRQRSVLLIVALTLALITVVNGVREPKRRSVRHPLDMLVPRRLRSAGVLTELRALRRSAMKQRSLLRTDASFDALSMDQLLFMDSFPTIVDTSTPPLMQSRNDLQDPFCLGSNHDVDVFMQCDCGANAPPLPMEDDFSFVEDFFCDNGSHEANDVQQDCMQNSSQCHVPSSPSTLNHQHSVDKKLDSSSPDTAHSTSCSESNTVPNYADVGLSSVADYGDIYNDPHAARLYLQSIHVINQLMTAGRRVIINGVPILRFGGEDLDLRLRETYRCREQSPRMGLLLDACLYYVPNRTKNSNLCYQWESSSNPRLNCLRDGFEGNVDAFVSDPHPKRRKEYYRTLCKLSKPCKMCLKKGSRSRRMKRNGREHIFASACSSFNLNIHSVKPEGDIHNDPVAFNVFLHSLHSDDKLLAGALFVNPSHISILRLGGTVYNLNSVHTFRRARKESTMLGLFLDACVVVIPRRFRSSSGKRIFERFCSPRIGCLSRGYQGDVDSFLSDPDQPGEIHFYVKRCSWSKPCSKCESPIHLGTKISPVEQPVLSTLGEGHALRTPK